MSSLIVSVVERGGNGLGSLHVADAHLPVGPFALQGAIESLDFAVMPGAVGAEEHVARRGRLGWERRQPTGRSSSGCGS